MDEPAFGEPEGHEGLRPEEADVVAPAGGGGAAGARQEGRGVGTAALRGLGHVARLEARRGEGPDQGRESRGLTRGRGRGGQARDGGTGGDALEVARRAAGAGRAGRGGARPPVAPAPPMPVETVR